MRQLISKRQQEGTPFSRPRSFVTELSTPAPPATLGTSNISLLSESVADADKLLASALSSHETLHQNLTQVVSDFKEVRKDNNSQSHDSLFRIETIGLGESSSGTSEHETSMRTCEESSCRCYSRERDHVRGLCHVL